MTTDDATVTIAGLQAQVKSLSEACHALGADCVEAVAQANSLAAAFARAEAERDALAAKLTTASKVCALHDVALAGEAAAQLAVQLAAARRVIDERTAERDHARADDQQTLSTWLRLLKAIDPTAENTDDALRAVARLTARVAELEAETRVSDQRLVDQHDVWKARVAKLEARPVLDVGRLAAALNQCELGPRASDIMRHLGPVTLLPAQDRAEELIASYVDEFAARYEAEGNPPRMDRWHEVSAERRKFSIETMAATLAKLGAAATTPAPPAAPPTPWTPRRSR